MFFTKIIIIRINFLIYKITITLIQLPFKLFEKDSKKPFESAELLPGDCLDMVVEFRPETIDQFEENLEFQILHNDFDTIQVNLFGECFNQAISIENLPVLPISLAGIDSTSIISFDDLALRDERNVLYKVLISALIYFK